MTAKKGQGRPIGRRVREALQILERLGPCSRADVLPHMANMTQLDDPSKYLRRAVVYGLAEQISDNPARYRAVPDWQEVLMRPPEQPKRGYQQRFASVWDYAQRAGLGARA